MVTLVVVCCGLLSALPAEADDARPPTSPPTRRPTRTPGPRSGRDADAHVRLALWCEAHGLHAERLKHLAIAALIEPGHATARGLMGLVAHAGGWKRPEAVADQAQGRRRAGRDPRASTRPGATGRRRRPTPSGSWPSGARRTGWRPRRRRT